MGANVFVFGQCLWGVLNALARAAALLYVRLLENPQDAEARALLNALGELAQEMLPPVCETVPCPYCSKSSVVFLREVITDMGGHSIHHHVVNGTFPRFIYNFHNKVNAKLIRQHLEKHGCNDAFTTDGRCVVPPKAITFKNFLLRLKLRQWFFNEEDIFLYLHSIRVEYNPALARAYATLLRCLDGTMQLTVRLNAPYAAHPMAMLSQLMTPFVKKALAVPSMLATQAAFTEWLVNMQLDYMGVRDLGARKRQAAVIITATNSIKVAACTDNTCALESRGQDASKEPALSPRPHVLN